MKHLLRKMLLLVALALVLAVGAGASGKMPTLIETGNLPAPVDDGSVLTEAVYRAYDGDLPTYSYTTKYGYEVDPGGELRLFEEADDQYFVRYTYDDQGNLILAKGRTDLEGGSDFSTRYEYKDGLLTRVEERNDFRGNLDTDYTYTADGAIATETVSENGSPVYTATYTYDARGRQSRRVVVEESTARTTTCEYDGRDNLIRERTVWDGGWEEWQYSYNSKSELVEELVTDSDGSSATFTYTYDDQGRMIRKLQEDSVNTTLTEWTYGDHDRVLTQEISMGNNLVERTEYEYDADWNCENLRYYSVAEDGILRLSWAYHMTWAQPAAGTAFLDVPEGKWFTKPIVWAVEKEITAGTSPTAFSPNAACTRAQIVTFLWRSAGKPEPTKTDNPFTDVSEKNYFYKAVLWAVEKGITSGTTKTTFSPNDSCTRAQAVAFLYRSQGKPGVRSADVPFTDVPEKAYYRSAVLWAVENSVTAGTSPTEFSPNSPCTRAQIVAFLYRAEPVKPEKPDTPDVTIPNDDYRGEASDYGSGIKDGGRSGTGIDSGEGGSQSQAQPGVLTAAEWNDNSNWDLFRKLLQDQKIAFPAYGIDPRARVKVTVTGEDAAPAPDRTVLLKDSQGNTLWTGRTDENGVAYLFAPTQDGSFTAACGTREAAVTLYAQNPAPEIFLEAEGETVPRTRTQVMFILDTTGSMDDEVDFLKEDFSAIAAEVGDQGVEFSVNFYRDQGDEYVTRTNPFTADVEEVQKLIAAEEATGGGDNPEAVAEILTETLTKNDAWREDAAKLAFLIFDAPPHEGEQQAQALDAAVRSAAERGILLVPVVASNADRGTELFGRALAICTGGTYVFLTDDSGVGFSHLEPIVGDYTVEALHDIIVRIIRAHQVSPENPDQPDQPDQPELPEEPFYLQTRHTRTTSDGSFACEDVYTYDDRGLAVHGESTLRTTHGPTDGMREFKQSYDAEYDSQGCPVKIVTDDGVETFDYIYDGLRRMRIRETAMDYTDPAFTDFSRHEEWDYDEAGNLIREKDDQREIFYTYDGDRLVRQTCVESWGTETLDFIYDEAGNLIREDRSTDQDGTTGSTFYTYDDAGRLLTETRKAGDLVTYRTAWTYDDRGSVIKEESQGFSGSDAEGNPDPDTAYTVSTEYVYTYNDAGLIATETRTSSYDGEPYGSSADFRYEYDEAGNRIRQEATLESGTTVDVWEFTPISLDNLAPYHDLREIVWGKG